MSDDRRQQAVAYLLGELDPEQKSTFEAELEADSELSGILDGLGPVVERLETLPNEAWESPDPPPLVMPGSPPTAADAPAERAGARRPGFGWLRVGFGLAAALTILVVGVLIGAQLGDSGPDSPGTPERTLSLAALGEAPASASGKVILASSDDDAATLDVSGLKPTGGNEFYELWLLDSSDDLISLGSFRVDPDGKTRIEVPLPVKAGDYRYFDVSIQPENGSPVHSGRSVLRGTTKA